MGLDTRIFSCLVAGLMLLGSPSQGYSQEMASTTTYQVATATNGVASWVPDPEIIAQIASDPFLIQKKLEIAMRKVVANPKTLEISFEPSSAEDTKIGKYKKITVKTEEGVVDNLVLHKVDVEFNDVQLNTTKLFKEEKIDTIAVGDINMDAVILEADLNAFVQAKSKSIKVDDPNVKMEPGKITLSGSTKYSFMKMKFWATGTFGVKDTKGIWFYPKKIKVNGMGMPRAFVGTIVKKINPILNLEKFPFRLNLKEIKIEKEALHFTSARTGN